MAITTAIRYASLARTFFRERALKWFVETAPSIIPSFEPSAHTCRDFLYEFGTEGV